MKKHKKICGCVYEVNHASPAVVKCNKCGGLRKVNRFGNNENFQPKKEVKNAKFWG